MIFLCFYVFFLIFLSESVDLDFYFLSFPCHFRFLLLVSFVGVKGTRVKVYENSDGLIRY